MIKQFLPSQQLNDWIDYIWVVKILELPKEQRCDVIMPSGHMNVIFNFGDSYKMQMCERWFVAPDIAVGGQIKTALNVLYGASVYQIGIALKPVSFVPLFGTGNDTLTEKVVAGTDWLISAFDEMKRLETVEARVAFLWNLLDDKKQLYHEPDELVVQMQSYIEEHLEDFTVTEMAAYFYLSVSTLERRFKSRMGLTPKSYADIKRFVNQQGCDEDPYYDQSHLIKATKRYTGKTPKSLKGEQCELTLDFMLNHMNKQEEP